MKKVFVTSTLLILIISLCSFTFPSPNWGNLYKERKEMVSQSELELYVEASPSSAEYFGARLEPKAGAYIGIIPTDSEKFAPVGSYLTYFDGMNQSDIYYPDNSIIKSDDSAVMVGWVISDINNVDYGKMKQVLDTLKSYNRPMYIRFANEMNVSSIGDDPDKYVEVFRKAADLIHKYNNFAVVWAPNDLGALDRPFEYYYPGDDYVDWIGVSCYSIKYFLGNKNTSEKDSIYFMTGDNAWATNRLKPIVSFMEKNNIKKPLMLSECGVPTNNSHGDSLEDWASPRFRDLLWNVIMKYPQVKMINYFNTHRANEVEKYDITNYKYAVNIFNEAANSGAYLQSVNDTVDFVFKKASECEALNAENGILELYTLAHFPGKSECEVKYFLDGSLSGTSNKIPYKHSMNISALSNGKHTVTIDSNGSSKSYTFYKSGSTIFFISPNSSPDKEISVILNGKKLLFPEQPPIISNDRVLVPVREIFEALGANVKWKAETRTVLSSKGSATVSLSIDSNKIYVNGTEKIIDVPAQLINSKTMVPVRAVSESYKCDVQWIAENRTVIINQ